MRYQKMSFGKKQKRICRNDKQVINEHYNRIKLPVQLSLSLSPPKTKGHPGGCPFVFEEGIDRPLYNFTSSYL